MWNRFLINLSGVLLLVGYLSAVPAVLAANRPAFNNLQGDQEFLRAMVSGTDIFSDPVETNPGDEIEVEVYYHNTVVDTVAKNTRIKITLPDTRGSKHSVRGVILSDSTPPVSGTVVAGQEVGSSNLTLSASASTALLFVPGSLRWFPDRAFPTGNGTPLPDNQNGDTIISSGVSLGDIKGGFNHAGVIRFKVKTVIPPPATQPNLSISQEAHRGGSNDPFYGKITVKPGSPVEYAIAISNAEDAAAAEDVALRVVLPVGITYQGNPVLRVNGKVVPLREGLAGRNGVKLFATLAPGERGEVTFTTMTSADLKIGSCGVSKAVVSARGVSRPLEAEASVCFSAADPSPLATGGEGGAGKPSPLPAILFLVFTGGLLWFYIVQKSKFRSF